MTKLLKFDKTCILDSSRQDFSNDIYFDWFLGRPHFFIVFGNDIIMTSFLVTWSSNLHILWNLQKTISLQRFSSVDCLGQVLQRGHKNTMMTSCWRHFILWDSKFQYFVKLVIIYQPTKFQILQLFESNFTEDFIIHPKIPLCRHFTVFGFQNCTFCT